MSKQKRADGYEDFYARTFTRANIEDIIQAGGGMNFESFKKETQGNTASSGHRDALFKGKQQLGREIFNRFFMGGNLTKNVKDRLIVRKGQTLEFEGKTFKGGQFVPKRFSG